MRGVLAGGLSGALLAAAGEADGLGALVLVALAPLLATATRRPAPVLAVAAAGFACGAVFYGGQIRGLLGVPWAPAPWVGLAVVLALALAVAGFAVTLAAIARRAGRGTALAAAPALWVGLEALAGRPPFEIAWLDLGAVLAGDPRMLALAPLGGAPLLAAWAVASSACLVQAARAACGAAQPPRAATFLVLAPLAAAVGAPERTEPLLRVAAVQPNVPAASRHGAERLEPNLRRLLVLSRQAVASGADLLVWPETAWDATAARGGYGFVGVVAHDLEVPLLTGARLPGSSGGLRNAVILAPATGATQIVGEKQHPVPAFEAAPAGRLGRALARRGLWPGRVAPGPRASPVVVLLGGEAVPLAVLVCADLHDAALARRLRREGARLLVVLANEADLGPGAAAGGERLARLRAAESRVPVVRVANTGRSVWIDARGGIVAALPAGRPGARGAALAPAGAASLHARHGPAPALALLLPFSALLRTRVRACPAAPIRGATLLSTRRHP